MFNLVVGTLQSVVLIIMLVEVFLVLQNLILEAEILFLILFLASANYNASLPYVKCQWYVRTFKPIVRYPITLSVYKGRQCVWQP